MRSLGLGAQSDYLAILRGPGGTQELRALADALIIGETYFFRGRDHLDVLRRAWLAGPPDRRWRILSAGCSSGEEPYSIAMLADQLGLAGRIAIDAVDVSREALARAEAGEYSPWSLRDTPPEVRRRYFSEHGRRFRIDQRIRGQVRFAECNLLDRAHPLWQRAGYDAVFCRNVLIYFRPDVVESVVGRLAGLVEDGGFLFLGHSEALHTRCPEIELECEDETVFYRKHAGAAGQRSGEDWLALIDGIHRELDEGMARPRLETLPASSLVASPQAPGLSAPRTDVPGRPAPIDPVQVGRLLREERFREALGLLDAAPDDDLPSQVLRAELMFVNGDLEGAHAHCHALLARHFLEAELHQLAAMLCEQRGEPSRAVEHARRASYLDPHFAPPHVLLGRLSLRQGQPRAARTEFEAAIKRLPNEREHRLRLLSGGFGRDALLRYCESQIRACGDSR
nr:CheR family methyltransferase [Lysobacter sp. CAU 1642]